MLSSYDLPVFKLDAVAPDSSFGIAAMPSPVSSQHVEIGVNIAEEQGWSSPLTLTCQIRSFAQSWEPVTWFATPTVFDGKTMFSFRYDFSDLGDPSTLSEQADLNC